MLDDLGLGPALGSPCEIFSARTGIATGFRTVVFSNRRDIEAETGLYRMAQAALTNVERHAQAERVTVQLFGHCGGATPRVSDDGRGLGDGGHGAGLGLRDMAERIEQLDGSLAIRPGPGGRGTQVEASVPLSRLLRPDARPPAAQAAE